MELVVAEVERPNDWLMLGWCTPLIRYSSDWVVPVSSITSCSRSPRSDTP